MRMLLLLALLSPLLSTAQSQDWESVLKTKNLRNFEGFLATQNANANSCLEIQGEQLPLLIAARKYSSDYIVNWIIETKAIDQKALCNRRTLLMHAVELGETGLVERFLRMGADPTFKTGEGVSAFDLAAVLQSSEIVALFQEHMK